MEGVSGESSVDAANLFSDLTESNKEPTNPIIKPEESDTDDEDFAKSKMTGRYLSVSIRSPIIYCKATST